MVTMTSTTSKTKATPKASKGNPVKVSPAEQAAQAVAEAEHYARTKVGTPEYEALDAEHRASVERALDSLRAKAVHAIIGLDSLTDAHTAYVKAHMSTIATVQRRAESADTDARKELESVKERAGQARKLSSELTANMAIDAYRLTKVHKTVNVTTLASVWGFSSRKRLDPYVHAGEHASKLSTTSVENIQWLIRQAKDHAGALREAVNGPGASMTSVREHVRKVAEGKQTAKVEAAESARTQAEAARAEQETPDVEAAKVGYRFSQLLVLLNKTDARIADAAVLSLSGQDVIRHVRTALDAYDARIARESESKPKPKALPKPKARVAA